LQAVESSEPIEALRSYDSSVSSIRQVNSARKEALDRMGLSTVRRLLDHSPLRYLDFSTRAPILDLVPGMEATVVGTILSVKTRRPRHRLTLTEIAIGDDSGGVLLGVWYNQEYIASTYREGQTVAFAGSARFEFGFMQMRRPFVEILADSSEVAELNRILPVHPATAQLTSNWIRRLITSALSMTLVLPDYLPAGLRIANDLTSRRDAIAGLHFPRNSEHLAEARRRLAYDELLFMQIAMGASRLAQTPDDAGFRHRIDGPLHPALKSALPFALSGEQQLAVGEIAQDMSAPKPMNRMLIGDVGTGKTVVAGHALAIAVDSDAQALMMAPTEVLVEQYRHSLGPMLDKIGVRYAILTGSTPQPARKEILSGLASGRISVVFGTHALLEESVTFHNLTLAIVDEQHRFGVAQRRKVREKGSGVDLLVMTATPIPRSLSLTYYGDLDATYLKSYPRSRPADHITTRCLDKPHREEAYAAVREAVAAGHQAYVICPLVEESDALDLKAVTAEVHRLRTEVFPGLSVAHLTGKMTSAEKSAVMTAFREGKIDVLVSTTVVEVGVDVPNATVMIVEDAERFGLAQLHQLRGRIGRGIERGAFFAFADPKSDDGRARMRAFEESNDGFLLAQIDLDIRGPGQIFGEKQSGIPELKFASLSADLELIERARYDARMLLESDPGLQSQRNRPLHDELQVRLSEAQRCVSSG